MRKKGNNPEEERIFEPDVMILKNTSQSETLGYLLKQERVFFLKDIARLLNINSGKGKLEARKITKRKKSAWAVMGARKIGNHWLIRM